jgi:hypothetical protein
VRTLTLTRPAPSLQVLLLANDITHRAGSFGTLEDALFFHASAWARRKGIPRIYLAGAERRGQIEASSPCRCREFRGGKGG